MRIGVAGFQHETNTFSPWPTAYDDFLHGGMFPALRRGQRLFELRQVNVPAGGFMNEVAKRGAEIVPIIWAAATPGGRVAAEAYERLASEICDGASAAGLDALYLDLHGAMACEHLDDGEGELLCRLRRVLPTIPIVATVDLHANVTEAMLHQLDGLVSYRTYPHYDMAETGQRAAKLLAETMSFGRLALASLRLPFLIPINAMATSLSPAKEVYDLLATLEQDAFSLSFAPGFPAADFFECGPRVWGYDRDAARIQSAVEELYNKIAARPSLWSVSFVTATEAVRKAEAIARSASKPVVLADTQDNPGAGGSGDTTGLLTALAEAGVENAAIGLMVDPEAAQIAHKVGLGGEVAISLGGKTPGSGSAPFRATFTVDHLSDGRCQFKGPMLTGKEASVGPTTTLRLGGLRVVVSTLKDQLIDREQYRMAGINPENSRILANKSSVHFRADFEPIASHIIVVKAPGVFRADPSEIDWKNLPRWMRTLAADCKPVATSPARLNRP